MFLQYLAQYYDGYHNMMDGGDWGWGLVMMFFFVASIVLIVLMMVRGVHWHNSSSNYSNDALGIAEQRYAKGEITKEEFEQLKNDLK